MNYVDMQAECMLSIYHKFLFRGRTLVRWVTGEFHLLKERLVSPNKPSVEVLGVGGWEVAPHHHHFACPPPKFSLASLRFSSSCGPGPLLTTNWVGP